MADDAETIERAYKEYFEAFQTLDPRAVVPYFHVPALALTSRGTIALTSAAEVEAFFVRMMGRLKGLGYARSTITDLHITRLSDSVALLSIRGARFRADGTRLEEIGATYTLHKTGAGWKMAVLVLHDPDKFVGSP